MYNWKKNLMELYKLYMHVYYVQVNVLQNLWIQ